MWSPWSVPIPFCSKEQLKKWEKLDPKKFWYKIMILFWIAFVGLIVILLLL